MEQERRSHHDLSPSTWIRRKKCPGSRRAESGLPDRDTVAAQVGTICHEVLEGKRDATSDEISELVAWVKDRCDEINPDAFAWRIEEEHFLIYEKALVTRGRIDRWSTVPEEDGSVTAHVVDAKFGWELPEPEVPMVQIAGYGVMVLQACPGVAQAKCKALYARHREVVETTVTREDIPRIVDWVRKLDEETKAEDAPLNPGDHCRYCRALGRCAATTEMALAPRPDMTQLSDPAVLAKSLTACLVLEGWVEQVREYAKANWNPQLEAYGWKLSQRVGARYVPDGVALYRAISSVMDVESMLGTMRVVVGDLEDAFIKAYVAKHGGSKDNARAALGAMAGGAIKRKGPSLCLTHNRRK